jgi:hypothetical protein
MMYDWYNLFNLTEFLALNLVSRTLQVVLSGIGQKDILITRGNEVSIVFEDVILPVQFSEENPFTRVGDAGTYGVYIDEAQDVWLGILQV